VYNTPMTTNATTSAVSTGSTRVDYPPPPAPDAPASPNVPAAPPTPDAPPSPNAPAAPPAPDAPPSPNAPAAPPAPAAPASPNAPAVIAPVVAAPAAPPAASAQELAARAKAKAATAEAARDVLLQDFADDNTKAQVKLFADCATAGVPVKKVKMALAAMSEKLACALAVSTMRLNASCCACNVTAASSVRRRLLIVSLTYDVDMFINPVNIEDEEMSDAIDFLAVAGIDTVATEDDPISALRSVPGMDAGRLLSFATDAADAAAASFAAVAAEESVDTTPAVAEPNPTTAPTAEQSVPDTSLDDVESSATEGTTNTGDVTGDASVRDTGDDSAGENVASAPASEDQIPGDAATADYVPEGETSAKPVSGAGAKRTAVGVCLAPLAAAMRLVFD